MMVQHTVKVHFRGHDSVQQSSVALLSSALHAEFFITIDHKELGGEMAGGRRQWRMGGKGCRSCGRSAVDSFRVGIRCD